MAERLAAAAPLNAGWQRDLSVSHDRVGRVLAAQGEFAEALTATARPWPFAAVWLRPTRGTVRGSTICRSSHERIGDALAAQADHSEALGSYARIRRHSRATDRRRCRSNAGWQRDLAVCYERVGDVFLAQAKLPEALNSFRARFGIAARLAGADAEQCQLAAPISRWLHSKLGEVFARQGNVEQLLIHYRAALAIVERLIAMDATMVQWRIDAVEFQRELALHGDDRPRRIAFVAAALRQLRAEVGLSAEHAAWLSEAEAMLEAH